MKHLFLAVLGLFFLQACCCLGDGRSAASGASVQARPEIRYYEIADA